MWNYRLLPFTIHVLSDALFFRKVVRLHSAAAHRLAGSVHGLPLSTRHASSVVVIVSAADLLVVIVGDVSAATHAVGGPGEDLAVAADLC
jgi:hypothetical protein